MKFKIFEKYKNLQHLITQRDTTHKLHNSMAMHTGEHIEHISQNRERLREYFGDDVRFFSVLQTHSSDIYIVNKQVDYGWSALDTTIEADALITDIPNQVLTILTADCVPILLYDTQREVIAAIHAGWRGTDKKIVQKCVAKMIAEYGTDPKDIVAGVAPAIGGCCYEVSEEIASYFHEYPEYVVRDKSSSIYLNLKSINRAQLVDMGVPSEQIEVSNICTACQNEDYFSYRKEKGCSGRFMSAIMLTT